jgi:hypothetical protein
MMTMVISGSDGVTFPDSTNQFSGGAFSFKNRIINGDMRIDQRNAGASVTITNTADNTFTLDRWAVYGSQASKFSVQQNAGSVTPPPGFSNYLGVTSLSAYSIVSGDRFYVSQFIEGFNTADLMFGTANAKTVTLSFWVRSSLTGTFGGAIQNSAVNRNYPFTYSISVADTWEQKSVTIAGDTSGTWLTTNGVGLRSAFGLAVGASASGTAGAWGAGNFNSATGATSVVGTNAATWYITGVQLEVGSVATPFERRPYGTELALCQRYYYKQQATGGDCFFGSAFNNTSTEAIGLVVFPVTMRVPATALEQSGTAGHYRVFHNNTNTTCSAVPAWQGGEIFSARVSFTVASGLTTGQGNILRSVNSSAFLAWSAEL